MTTNNENSDLIDAIFSVPDAFVEGTAKVAIGLDALAHKLHTFVDTVNVGKKEKAVLHSIEEEIKSFSGMLSHGAEALKVSNREISKTVKEKLKEQQQTN